MGSGTKMMRNQQMPMHQFENTEEAQAFRTAVEAAIEKKDYSAFKAAHTKYGVENIATEDEFNEMITRRSEAETRRAEMEKIREQANEALKKGNYDAWIALHKDSPMGEIINTEAKFKQLQEMHTYQEKARTIGEELGLPWPKGEGMGQRMKDGMRQGRGMGMWNK